MTYQYIPVRSPIALTQTHFCVCVCVLGQVYDLSSAAESMNSAPGCSLTDGVCVTAGGPSCGLRGKCLGEWGSFSCDCHPGYSGHKCDNGESACLHFRIYKLIALNGYIFFF